MKLTFNDYYDKVLGCYTGKNIGGTLGAPFECFRGVYDIDWFQQDVSHPVPNDDVDLQLVWLRAIELEGAKIDSHVLAEYWNTYICATLSEYGTGKNNFNMGIEPPLCGRMRNPNKDSNGAWIRSEIWACACAGNPQLAATYAYFDSSVDHADEGVYAAVFCAVIESAAFFEKDIRKLIETGKSYIPEDCKIVCAVDTAIKCYDSGKSWKEARKEMFRLAPTNFGMMAGYWKGTDEVPANERVPAQTPDPEIPHGSQAFDAIWHMGALIISLLYGENDFAKTVCIAVNMGEDTDCTAGTAGAILGIIMGEKALPLKWKKACSDKIATCTLRYDQYLYPPKTVKELAYRVARQAPVMLGYYYCDIMPGFDYDTGRIPQKKDYFTITAIPEFRYTGVNPLDWHKYEDVKQLITEKNVVTRHFDLYNVKIAYDEDLVKIEENAGKKLRLTFLNKWYTPQYLQINLLNVPEEWEVKGGKSFCVGLEHWHGGVNYNSYDLEIIPRGIKDGVVSIVMEISANGRLSKNYIPLTFIQGAC